ncbi:Signal transduction histidine-protein kinase BaeS [Bacillus sp. MB95]|nr:Signal transduction histidine-protein kinase BaeS [Bacillus sp. MB95]
MLLQMRRNKNNIWRTRLFWELTILNMVVIGIVIWVAGVSVKDFACFLANELNIAGRERQAFFHQTMNFYLLRASVIAVLLGIIIHYIWVRRIIVPIQALSTAMKEMGNGNEVTSMQIIARNEVGELTNHFNTLLEKIKRAETLRNEMTADLAHEVRTPLSNLTGYLEALKDEVIAPNKKLLQSLYSEAERLKRMIEQLHHLSEKKWRYYMNDYKTKAVDVEAIVHEVIDLYYIKCKSEKIRIEKDIEDAYFLVSSNMLKQALSNLLDNAIQYAVEDTVIRVKGQKRKNHYLLCVEGKGQKIPIEATTKLFERFYRIDPSRNRESGGSGLGLSIVKKLVEDQGGKVWLETNEIYHQFFISFPLNKNVNEQQLI